MANLNKVMLIGRLTRDPEITEFDNGGKVAEMGFAVNNRRKNPVSGEWEDVPVWLNLKAFNRAAGRKLADLAGNNLRKGRQVYVEGHLALEEWTGKEDGKHRTKTLVYVDGLEFLGHGKNAPGAQAAAGAQPAAGAAAAQPQPEKPAAAKPAGAGRGKR